LYHIYSSRTNKITYIDWLIIAEHAARSVSAIFRTRSVSAIFRTRTSSTTYNNDEGANLLVFCSSYDAPTHFRKRSLTYRSMALPKHVAHYSLPSGFPYFNLDILPSRGLPLPAAWGCAEQLCGLFDLWEPSPVPSATHLKVHRCQLGCFREWHENISYQRAIPDIVITYHLASIVCFLSTSLKPCNNLKRKFPVWSFTMFIFFLLVENSSQSSLQGSFR
jgi:hypothetical protein